MFVRCKYRFVIYYQFEKCIIKFYDKIIYLFECEPVYWYNIVSKEVCNDKCRG